VGERVAGNAAPHEFIAADARRGHRTAHKSPACKSATGEAATAAKAAAETAKMATAAETAAETTMAAAKATAMATSTAAMAASAEGRGTRRHQRDAKKRCRGCDTEFMQHDTAPDHPASRHGRMLRRPPGSTLCRDRRSLAPAERPL
jgi:hypothetical protein